jgi:hypothetical protein
LRASTAQAVQSDEGLKPASMQGVDASHDRILLLGNAFQNAVCASVLSRLVRCCLEVELVICNIVLQQQALLYSLDSTLQELETPSFLLLARAVEGSGVSMSDHCVPGSSSLHAIPQNGTIESVQQSSSLSAAYRGHEHRSASQPQTLDTGDAATSLSEQSQPNTVASVRHLPLTWLRPIAAL